MREPRTGLNRSERLPHPYKQEVGSSILSPPPGVRADWNTSTIVQRGRGAGRAGSIPAPPLAWTMTHETPPYCGRRSPEFGLVSGYGVSMFTLRPWKSKSLRWCLTHLGAARNPG
jgi:hypothetical protein